MRFPLLGAIQNPNDKLALHSDHTKQAAKPTPAQPGAYGATSNSLSIHQPAGASSVTTAKPTPSQALAQQQAPRTSYPSSLSSFAPAPAALHDYPLQETAPSQPILAPPLSAQMEIPTFKPIIPARPMSLPVPQQKPPAPVYDSYDSGPVLLPVPEQYLHSHAPAPSSQPSSSLNLGIIRSAPGSTNHQSVQQQQPAPMQVPPVVEPLLWANPKPTQSALIDSWGYSHPSPISQQPYSNAIPAPSMSQLRSEYAADPGLSGMFPNNAPRPRQVFNPPQPSTRPRLVTPPVHIAPVLRPPPPIAVPHARKAIYELEIEVEHGRTVKLVMYEGEHYRDVVRMFGQFHGMRPEYITALEKIVSNQIGSQ